jgi:hypothetical protein
MADTKQWIHDMHGALIIPRNCALDTFNKSTTIPKMGEILITYDNTDTYIMKVGNGKDVFEDLPILATTELTNSDGVNINLSNYVKKSDLNNYLSLSNYEILIKNYATKEELNEYLKKENYDTSTYCTYDDLNDYVTINKFNEVIDSLTISGGSDLTDVTIEKLATPNDGYSSSYQLKVNGNVTGDVINIPKDLVVQSGSVNTVTEVDNPVEGYVVGDKYIDLLLANSDDEHIYILVSDLVTDEINPDGKTTFFRTLDGATYLSAVGYKADGETFTYNDTQYTANQGNIIFNGYTLYGGNITSDNMISGYYNTVFGNSNKLLGQTTAKAVVMGGDNILINSSSSLLTGSTNYLEESYHSLMIGSNNNAKKANTSLIGGDSVKVRIDPKDGVSTNDIFCSIIYGDGTNIYNTSRSSLTIGMADKITYTETSLISGHSNTVENSSGSIIVGYGHTITQSTDSYINGYSNIIAAATNSDINGNGINVTKATNSYINGNKNTINSTSCSIISGDTNTVTNIIENSFLTGYSNSLVSAYNSIISSQYNTFGGFINYSYVNGSSNYFGSDVPECIICGDSINYDNASSFKTFAKTNDDVSNLTRKSLYRSFILGSNHNIYQIFENSILIGYNNGTYYAGIDQLTNDTAYINNSIIGGQLNKVYYSYNSLIMGEHNNIITDGLTNSIISGSYNTISNSEKVIIGGTENVITSTHFSILTGYQLNMTDSNIYISLISLYDSVLTNLSINKSIVVGSNIANTNKPNVYESLIVGEKITIADDIHYSLISGLKIAYNATTGCIANGKECSYTDITSSIVNLNNGVYTTINESIANGTKASYTNINNSIINGNQSTYKDINNSFIIMSQSTNTSTIDSSLLLGKQNTFSKSFTNSIVNINQSVNKINTDITDSIIMGYANSINVSDEEQTFLILSGYNNTVIESTEDYLDASTITSLGEGFRFNPTIPVTQTTLTRKYTNSILLGNYNNYLGWNSIITGVSNTIVDVSASYFNGYQNTIYNVLDSLVIGYMNYINVNKITSDDDSKTVTYERDSSNYAASSIIAGSNNNVKNIKSSLVIGETSTSSGIEQSILAGYNNSVKLLNTSLLIGMQNTLNGNIYESVIAGKSIMAANGISESFINGSDSSLINSITYSIINGYKNTIGNTCSSIIVGDTITLAGGANYSIIGGNSHNFGSTSIQSSLVVGSSNIIPNGATGSIISGLSNQVIGSNTQSIISGLQNVISSTCNSSFMIGSENKVLSSICQSIVSGMNNTLTGGANQSIIGGSNNSTTDSMNQTLLMGQGNTIYQSSYSIISGYDNTLNYVYESLIVGYGIKSSGTSTSLDVYLSMICGQNIKLVSSTTNSNNITYSIISGNDIQLVSSNIRLSLITGSSYKIISCTDMTYSILAGSSGTINNSDYIFDNAHQTTISNSERVSIIGGYSNSIYGASNLLTVGSSNIVGTNDDSFKLNQMQSLVVGSNLNITEYPYCSIVSGYKNKLVYGNVIARTIYSIISGENNTINSDSQTVNSSIVSGYNNTINIGVNHSFILGSSLTTSNNSDKDIYISASVVGGISNKIIHNVYGSLIFGIYNTITAPSCESIVAGQYNTILSSFNFGILLGEYNLANSTNQLVMGRYNIPDTNDKYYIIVGNGTSTSDRSNIMTLDTDGNMNLNTIYIHKTDDSTDYVDIRTLLGGNSSTGDITVSTATTTELGIVKPDNETITVDENGVLSVIQSTTSDVDEIVNSSSGDVTFKKYYTAEEVDELISELKKEIEALKGDETD